MKKSRKPTKRQSKNPVKPLDFYIKCRPGLENYVLFKDLTEGNKLELRHAFANDSYKLHRKSFILEYNNKVIPYEVGFISTRYYSVSGAKYILGIVEFYKETQSIEVHTFENKIENIKLQPTKAAAEMIFDKLLQAYKFKLALEKSGIPLYI